MLIFHLGSQLDKGRSRDWPAPSAHREAREEIGGELSTDLMDECL
jgi:hypothetical protein